jgi:hypothetical protein
MLFLASFRAIERVNADPEEDKFRTLSLKSNIFSQNFDTFKRCHERSHRWRKS